MSIFNDEMSSDELQSAFFNYIEKHRWEDLTDIDKAYWAAQAKAIKREFEESSENTSGH